jgi:MoxR-like ATPase
LERNSHAQPTAQTRGLSITQSPGAAIAALRDNISSVLFGGHEAVDSVIACLLSRGHVLIEDVPGVGKTLLASALARSIDCSFARIQLTPDMLPGDIVGVSVLDRDKNEFVFRHGPLFANIVLADEINRTPPRTQSALLEAMAEGSVSVDGRTMRLSQPFMVVATQNPFEFEGTYPLPENQLDRFLMRVSLGYPSTEAETRILRERPATGTLPGLASVLTGEDVVALQVLTDAVRVEAPVIDYIVAIAQASRRHPGLVHGISPRASLAMAQTARATALIAGREYVIPDDVVNNLQSVCAHRVVTRAGGAGEQSAQLAQSILQDVLRSVPAPL